MKSILKKGIVIVLSTIILMCALPAQQAEAAKYKIPTSAKSFGGHFYKVYRGQMNWYKAKEKCELLGGHLVTITSYEEQTFVNNLAEKSCNSDSDGCWLGAYESKGKLKWVTNENPSYLAQWADPEKNCAVFYSGSDGKYYWCNVESSSKSFIFSGIYMNHYICEWDISRGDILPDQVKLTSVNRASSKSATVSWKKVSDAKGYAVYMKKGQKGTYKKIGEVKKKDITSFTAKKLKSGQEYYFRVRAYKTIYGERSYGELSDEKMLKLSKN
jgi:hypothetical protein